MQSQRTIQQYRLIDLSIFAVLLAVFETVIARAGVSWFAKEAWMVSAVPAVTAIVMVRWGPWCAVHAALGGVVTVIAKGGGWPEVLIYAAGNLAALAVLPLLKKAGWRKLHDNFLFCLLFGVLVTLGMQLGRAVLALAFGAGFDSVWRMTAADSVTYIFSVAIVWIASRLDGILEDQAHYLRRLSHEPEQ